jgi:hypothetical protein
MSTFRKYGLHLCMLLCLMNICVYRNQRKVTEERGNHPHRALRIKVKIIGKNRVFIQGWIQQE